MSEKVDAKPIHRWTIPDTWSWTVASEIAQIIGGGTPSTKEPQNFDGGEIPWITPADLTGYREKMICRGERNITEKGLRESGARLLPAGTVLFSSRAPIGYIAIADNPVATNQGFKSFIPSQAVTSDFLYYYMQFARPIAKEMASGTTFLEISGAKAAQIPIPVAPLAEQKQIVDEIEKQFTRLDAATTALKRVQSNLKRYRASVLKAACEGRLVPTEAELARKEGRDYEPADKLLQRILRERRARWEADTLAKMQASGKPPKDDHWKQKYKEPSAPDISDLSPLPEGWCWMTLDSIVYAITAGKSFKCEERPPEEGEYGVVKVSSVTWGEFDELESKTCMVGSPWVEAYRICADDFLISRANTIELVGACVIAKDVSRKLMLSDKILRLEVVLPNLKKWLLTVLRSRWGRLEIERLSTGNQESMRNIGQDRLRSIRIPVPPLSEMERILPTAEMCEIGFGKLRDSTVAQVKRSQRMRQAILKDAFTGQLVSQDPTDEPASVLLERIRAERVESSKKTARKTCSKRGER